MSNQPSQINVSAPKKCMETALIPPNGRPAGEISSLQPLHIQIGDDQHCFSHFCQKRKENGHPCCRVSDKVQIMSSVWSIIKVTILACFGLIFT